jgi:hypothetical protein
MLTAFFDMEVVVHSEFVPQGQHFTNKSCKISQRLSEGKFWRNGEQMDAPS